MKKRFFIVVLFLILFVTGCSVSDEDRELLLNEVKDENLISDDYTQVDVMNKFSYGAEYCNNNYYYIYKDSNDNLIAIEYITHKYQTNYDYKYEVIIYNVKENTNIEYTDDASCIDEYKYRYSDNTISLEAKYEIDEDNANEYHYNINEKTILFFFHKTEVERVD